MKYRFRRFVALLIIISLSAYLGNKSLNMLLAVCLGVFIGSLPAFEDENYRRKHSCTQSQE